MLETLTNPGRRNIKNLTIEIPQSIGAPFDPKDKITRTEWDDILVQFEDLKNARQNITDTHFDQAVIITNIMLFDPQRASGLDLNPSIDYLLSRTMNARDTNGGFLQDYMFLMIISPMKAKECTENPRLQGHIHTLKWFNRVVKSQFQDGTSYLSGTDYESLRRLDTLFKQSYAIKIALPGVSELDYSFLGNYMENETAFIKVEEDEYKKTDDPYSFNDFLYSLVALKTLFPQEFSGKRLLGGQRWKLIADGFRKLREKFANEPSRDIFTARLLEACGYIKILASEEVVITEQEGIKLVMPSHIRDFALSNPALPAVRRF